MKHTLLLFFFIFSSFCYSQENCNNGIDDDGDGKIDLNDSDCTCNKSAITSIIPNPSFETKSDCPNSFSELNKATPWIQATSATTDYQNKCGFVTRGIKDLGLENFPDGDGIAAALFLPDWNEYLGTTLLSPLKANTNYQLTFNVAAYFENGSGEFTGKDVSLLEPVNITIYGCANGENLPLSTTKSPNSSDPTWIEIGSATYTPISSWGEVTMTFKTDFDVNAIMLGSPPTLPVSYKSTNGNPYFLFDNLLLNTSASFGVNISQQGSFCDSNLILKAELSKPVSIKKTFQWYQNGIAIVGATNESYKIPAFSTSLGQYTVKVTDGDNCFVSTKVTINNTVPSPLFSTIQPNCIVTTGTIKITTLASEYSFDNGETWQESSVKELLPVGNYYIKIKTQTGCISSTSGVNIVAPQLLANSDLSITQPTSCDGKGTIKINSENAVAYSFDDGVTWTTNSTASNLEPGNYLIKIKDAAGCQSSSQYAIINRVFLKDPIFTITQPTCEKAGKISISTIADEYSFDGGKTWTTDPVAVDLKPGSYLIQIKNNNGCQSNTGYAYIEQFYLKIYPTYSKTQPICGTGGTITITSEAAEYSFDAGQTWTKNPVAENLLPGYYSIIFRNELGCMSFTQNVNLDYFYLPDPAFTYIKPTCEIGGSITITTPANEYSFDGGATWSKNPTASNLKAGTYFIMIKNEIGCTSSTYKYVNLEYFYLPDPSYIAVNPYCGSIGSIEITTTTDSYSFDGGYTWTTAAKKTNLPSGYYYLKVKNNLGCESNTVGVYLDSEYLARPNYTLTQPSCGKNGSITITTKSDFYSFDNGNTWTTNPTLSDIAQNSYINILIKNNSDCKSSYLQLYIKPFYLDNPLYTVVQPTCGDSGSIKITTKSDYYSFDNGNTWTTNPVLTNPTPNNYYYIKIKNSAGCVSEGQYIFIQPFFLDNPNYTLVQPTCGTSGNLTITTKSDYYSFDNGSTWTTNPILANPIPNTYYYILIKNNLGCTSNTQYVSIPAFYLDNPSFKVEQPICGKEGTIAITTVSDQYSFDNGKTWTTNPVASNLSPGFYYIMIKNKLGCISTSQYAYIEPFYLEYPAYEIVQPSCEQKGSVTITTIADQYSFDSGNTWTTNPVLKSPTENYVNIKIKNDKGCESNTQTVYLNYVNTSPKPIVTTTPASNCGTKDGSITVTTNATSYSFDNGVTWGSDPNSGLLESGTYQVKIKTYSTSCPSEANIAIVSSKTILAAPLFSTIQTTCATSTGTITITTPATQYSFDNGITWQTGNSKNNLQPDNYLIKIKNDKGCISDAATAKIGSLTSFKIESYTSDQPLCAGASVNGITIKIATPASEYSFDNGKTWTTNPVATNLKENTEYCLKIKNAEGCVSEPSCMTTIKQVPIPKAPQIVTKQPTGCDSNGFITVNAAKGEYSFDDGKTWSKNQTSTPLAPGTYFVRTKEAVGECVSEASKAIINNPPDAPKTPETIVTQPTTCVNPFGSIQITSLESEYSFDGGITWTTDPFAKKLAVGEYTIKAKNSAGCQSNTVKIKIDAPTDYPNAPIISLIQPDCSNPKGNITISSTATQYSFNNGLTWATSNISDLLEPGDYYARVKNSNGCISEGTKVTIIPFTNFPALPAASKDQTFCIDQNATIADINIQGTGIIWYDTATTGNTLAETTLVENRTYYATQTLNSCESKRFAVVVKIQDTQNPIAKSPQSFCIQKNAKISDIDINGEDIKWFESLSVNTTLSESTLLQNDITYYASQTINNCESDRIPVTIKILGATTGDCINFVDELPFPKFFTPNNDGYNDTWTIDFVYLAPNTGIKIFDRYGKFIKELFNNGAWDGNYLDHEQPASDYWFTATRLNGTEYRGHFSLKR